MKKKLGGYFINLLSTITALLFLIMLLFSLTGCPPAAKDSSFSPQEDRNTENAKKPLKPRRSASIEKIEPPAGDPSADEEEENIEISNLEDLYIRLYGDDFIEMEGELPQFSIEQAYGDILSNAHNPRLLKEQYDKLIKDTEEYSPKERPRPSHHKVIHILKKAAYIEDMLKMDPEDRKAADKISQIHNTFYKKAKEMYQKREFYQGLPWAEAAAVSRPDDVSSLKLFGFFLAETGEEGLAIPCLALALEKEPYDYELQYYLKNLYMVEGDFEKAIPLINQYSSQYGRTKNPYSDLARAYLGLYVLNPHERDKIRPVIIENIQKGIQYRPQPGFDLNELHLSLALLQERYADAESICGQSLKLPLDYHIKTRLYYLKGLINYLQGNKQEACVHLKTVIDRVKEGEGTSQGENYMAQMSSWLLDIWGEKKFTPEEAKALYSKAKSADHSYQQEFGFILDYLTAREKEDYPAAIDALRRYLSKRHLEPVGDFAQDLLQVPAQHSLIYISLARLYNTAGETQKAEESLKKAEASIFRLLDEQLHHSPNH